MRPSLLHCYPVRDMKSVMNLTTKPAPIGIYRGLFCRANDRTEVIRRVPDSLLDVYDVEILVIDDSSADGTFAARDSDQLATQTCPLKLRSGSIPSIRGTAATRRSAITTRSRTASTSWRSCTATGNTLRSLAGARQPCYAGEADAVFGSRMMNPRDALKGGMPLYKFVGNRILTIMSESPAGHQLNRIPFRLSRLFSVPLSRQLPFDRNSNDFHFDTEIIIQSIIAAKRIKETRSQPITGMKSAT